MSTSPLNQGKVVIAGGSGYLGLNLAECLLQQDFEVVLLSRHRPKKEGAWTHIVWDGINSGEWVHALDGACALVNLAGRSVDCVKTPEHCDEILRSRVESTRALGRAIREVDRPPPVWVQMSTAHIYGDSLEVVCQEDSAFGFGLAPHVGQAWERAFAEAALPHMRQVILRTSFVLGRSGGALPRLATLARWGLGGKVGHGRQGISWIHESDMNALLVRAINSEGMNGAYLATSPNPISNAEFMAELRHAVRAPLGIPSPGWLVRRGAPLVMRTDPDLALYGRFCVSRRLREEGFEFQFPQISKALQNIYRNPKTAKPLKAHSTRLRNAADPSDPAAWVPVLARSRGRL